MTSDEKALGIAFTALVGVAHAGVVIGAGHGIAVVGLLMVGGTWDAWYALKAFGWAGLLCLGASHFGASRIVYAVLSVAGTVCLFLSWWSCYVHSDTSRLTLVTAFPFF